ncbi:MAG TPA: FtsQ-type POTRA domain-containing protein [Spirochaetota bacterium]|nr:FtsQ-type POTRA domain-containing protein [Spirochaetota bacterium]HPI89868.1 FtsQ-type POTRA domain-containing protein [Spirochaetota bacterium]HPR49843.1 FtsQ-type POTRA domain-containing protein [Spirochaetota bacterium]
MHRLRNILSAAAAAVSFSVCGVYAETGVFNTVEIRGMKCLAKEEIVRKVRLVSRNNQIIMDMDSLRSALKTFPIIKDYSIKTGEGRLILSIVEREPFVRVALHGKNQTVPFELDSASEVIAFNRIHCRSLPLVHVETSEMKGNEPGRKLKKLCSVLFRVSKEHPALFREIEEIYFSGGFADITLRGRRTHFYVRTDMDNFTRLTYIAGYLDSKRIYPERISITDDKVLIRQGV